MIIYQFSTETHETTFYPEKSNHVHLITMERDHLECWVKWRPNSRDECEAQYEGLSRIYNGETHVRVKSDHHVFEFSLLDDDWVSVTCITSGFFTSNEDRYDVYWDELEDMLEGFERCIEWYDEDG